MKRSSYFMDDSREANRLAQKVDGESWVEKYLKGYLHKQMAVLDIGCGPGHLAQFVAPYAKSVVGVDLHAERFPQKQLPSNLILRQGDANQLPFEDNSFDLGYIRFLLQYLPEKQKAVAELNRVIKPGGRILLQDLDGQLLWHHPVPKKLEEILSAVQGALEKTGFDPFTGRKLFSYLKTAEIENINVEIEPYHQIVGEIDEEQLKLWELKLDIAKKLLSKIKSVEYAENGIKIFLDHLKSPDTFTYSTIITASGIVA